MVQVPMVFRLWRRHIQWLPPRKVHCWVLQTQQVIFHLLVVQRLDMLGRPVILAVFHPTVTMHTSLIHGNHGSTLHLLTLLGLHLLILKFGGRHCERYNQKG